MQTEITLTKAAPSEQPYEPPRIEDYGTLTDLTANKHGGKSDFFGSHGGQPGKFS